MRWLLCGVHVETPLGRSEGEPSLVLRRNDGIAAVATRPHRLLIAVSLLHQDEVAKGYVELGPGTVCQEVNDKKKKNMFSIQGRGIKHANRVFMMYTDTPGDMNQWIAAIRKNVNALANGGQIARAEPETTSPVSVPAMMSSQPVAAAMPVQQTPAQPATIPVGGQTGSPVRQKVTSARDSIPFVTSGDSKLLEFWQVCTRSLPVPPASHLRYCMKRTSNNYPTAHRFLFTVPESNTLPPFALCCPPSIGTPSLAKFAYPTPVSQIQIWYESIPQKQEIKDDQSIEWSLAVSSDCNKLSWRTAGPQDTFIQKMVDFFWNVGAPESEIDRLNDVGASINPIKIGSWIDMSEQGGMDGGWFFPVDVATNVSPSLHRHPITL